MKIRSIILATSLLVPAYAWAQSAPAWKSYQDTGNPADMVKSTQVASWFGLKVDVTNGSANGLNISNGSSSDEKINNPEISGGSSSGLSISGGSAEGISIEAESLTSGDGTHNSPASGYRLGYNQNQYITPFPHFNGSVTVTGPFPSFTLSSIYGNSKTSFFMDSDKNTNIESYVSGGRVNVVTEKGALQIQDTASSSALWLVPSSNIVVPITADTGGGLTIGNGTSTSTTSLYLNFTNIRFGTTFISDTSKCGSLTGSSGCIPIVNSAGTSGYVPFYPE